MIFCFKFCLGAENNWDYGLDTLLPFGLYWVVFYFTETLGIWRFLILTEEPVS
jgi:hypothetical protein